MWSMAIGIEADDVLPEYWMSSATRRSSRAPAWRRRFAIASTMRRLAWWGTSTSMSAGVRPAASTARRATGAILVVAQRKTAWPSWRSASVSSMWIVETRSPAAPQTTGPTPTSSSVVAGPSTAAPAPSAKMMQVERSSMSSQSESFSEPITSTWRAVPERIMSPASPTP